MEPGRLEGRSPQVGSRGKANKLKQNVKIEYKFLRFRAKTFSNFINSLVQKQCLDSIFMHRPTQLKNKLNIQRGGLNPHNLPSGYIRGFFLVQTT